MRLHSRTCIDSPCLDGRYDYRDWRRPLVALRKMCVNSDTFVAEFAYRKAPFTPVVGAYSSESTGMGMLSGRGGAFGICPTSGAPWPKFDWVDK